MKLRMPTSIEPRKTPPSKAYFKNSWLMLKENYKAFIFTELFAILAFIITVISCWIIFSGIAWVIPPHITPSELIIQMTTQFGISIIFRILVSLIAGIVFIGFMSSQFGLANDIINSGEMFAQFKGSFIYFRKNWWQFYILTLLLFVFAGILPGFVGKFRDGPPTTIALSIWEILLFLLWMFLFFLWFVLFIHAFPSLVYKNKLSLALKESFLIFKQDFRTITKTWAIFFIFFAIPPILAAIFGIIFRTPSIPVHPMPVFALLFILIMIFLGFPFTVLLATGIYNNSYLVTATSIDQNPHDLSQDSSSNSERSPTE